jgi:ATP-dependent DNA helicase RecG
VGYLKQYKKATRSDINGLLISKMPDILSDNQKIKKIGNILDDISGKIIKGTGRGRAAFWELIQE